MSRPRVFLDSCVLIGGLAVPSSASSGLLKLHGSFFALVLAEAVYEETKRVFRRDFAAESAELLKSLDHLLKRLVSERLPHASAREVEQAGKLIKHQNDAPILAAAIKAKPDWLITDNTKDFTEEVSKRTGLRIATPGRFLDEMALPR